jgi:hypothetical protein
MWSRKALVACAPAILTACASLGPPQPPSLELPKPPTDLRAARKGDHVILTWTVPTLTTDRKTIRSMGPTRICRGSGELKQCGTPVGQTNTPISPPTPPGARKQKQSAAYTDTIPSDLLTTSFSAKVTYAVEVLNHDARGAGISNQVQVALIRTQPPPQELRAQVTGQGVVLTWTSHMPPNASSVVRYFYRAYRRLEGSQPSTLVGEVPAAGESNFTLTDSAIEWEKTYEYRVETVTAIAVEGKPAVRDEVQVEGDDTAEIKVFTHDIFPPAVPFGLQAVFSGPGQQPFVDLVWAPVPDLDLDGYNIYRREEGLPAVKLNAQPVRTPAYRDDHVAPGKNYLYSVSAVDVRGNESARSEETAEASPSRYDFHDHEITKSCLDRSP